jgi:hypothetical protein
MDASVRFFEYAVHVPFIRVDVNAFAGEPSICVLDIGIIDTYDRALFAPVTFGPELFEGRPGRRVHVPIALAPAPMVDDAITLSGMTGSHPYDLIISKGCLVVSARPLSEAVFSGIYRVFLNEFGSLPYLEEAQ